MSRHSLLRAVFMCGKKVGVRHLSSFFLGCMVVGLLSCWVVQGLFRVVCFLVVVVWLCISAPDSSVARASAT